MCRFFSFITLGDGQPVYIDWSQRKEWLESNPNGYQPDSHASICSFAGHNEDSVNKYEYCPLTQNFTVDQINYRVDDSRKAESAVRELDFSKIVAPLIIKPIVDPFKIKRKRVTRKELELLCQWDSVWDSVRDSVGDSVRDSVMASVRASVMASVRDSVWDSVRDSVRASVWNSVWDSVRAYESSFYNIAKWKYIDHKKGQNPFQPCIDLWHKGLVPSYDGEYWRLHTGGQILWKGQIVDGKAVKGTKDG